MTNIRLVPATLAPPTCDADRIISSAFFDLHAGFTQIEAFRIPALSGLDAGLPALSNIYREFLASITPQLGIAAPTPDVIERVIAEVFTPFKKASAQNAIDAASLVFAHALFESAIHAILDVAALVRKRALLTHLENRSVPLGALLDPLFGERVMNEELVRHIRELKRESIAKKLAALLRLFRCRSAFDSADVVITDERLVEIDRNRQAILHNSAFSGFFPTVEADIAYLLAAGNFYVAVAATSAALEVRILSGMNDPGMSASLSALLQPKNA
jgi:hypothetical protein